MPRPLTLALLLLTLGLFAAGLFLAPRLVSPAPQPLTIMPTGWPGDLGFVLIKRLGLDAAYGLDLNLQPIATSDDLVQGFRNGATDVLNFTLDVALTTAASDPDIRVIYAYNASAGADGMVARADIRTPADLKGRRVGAETGATSHYLLLAILTRAGLSPADISYVDVQADEVQEALSSGRVDAVVTWEPNLSAAAALPGMHVLTSSRDYPGLILNALIVRRAALEEQPETYARLVQAWDAMRALCEAEPQRCWDELAASEGRSATALAQEAEGIAFLRLRDNLALFPLEGGAGSVEAQLLATAAFLRATNPTLTSVDPATLYDPSVVQAAHQLSQP